MKKATTTLKPVMAKKSLSLKLKTSIQGLAPKKMTLPMAADDGSPIVQKGRRIVRRIVRVLAVEEVAKTRIPVRASRNREATSKPIVPQRKREK